MSRKVHSVAGLAFGLVLALFAGTGAILSLEPALERAQARPAGGASVAELAAQVAAHHPSVERLERRANGVVVASFATEQGFETTRVDPATGADLGPWEPSAAMRWIRDLHRSLLLDDPGKMIAGASAAVMAVLGVTGLLLLAGVLGGWRRLGRRVRSSGTNRWHAVIGRAALAGLSVSALTGAWMSLATFGIVSDGANTPAFPEVVAAGSPAPVGALEALRQTRVEELRRLTWPVAGDPTDVFGLQTAGGAGYLDQATGALLNWQGHSPAQKVWEWAYMLHTGQGLWWLGLLLGASAAAAPVLAGTGSWIWWKRRAARPRIAGAVPMAKADVVILAGSEGGATWGFAATLANALAAAGRKVHLGAMNDAGAMPAAKALILLTATYGDGVAPATAARFLSRLDRMNKVPVAVLGFGDRSFPAYCGFAETVAAALARSGWPELAPLTRIDRQSVRDFAHWGEALGDALGVPLELSHRVVFPDPTSLRLVRREAFGCGVGAPSAILRFEATPGARLPRFKAGDLLGVVAPGAESARFYSLASSRRDGFIEIAVRLMPDGLCSGHLYALAPGDEIRAFIRPNPGFRAAKGRAPVILVAAGCGIGPAIGLLRHLRPGRSSVLYFGIRHPGSDFLYRRETDAMLAEGRLSRRVMAFSRSGERTRVQDRLRENADELARQIEAGGQVLICGGAAMARDVTSTFDAILEPSGQTVADLKAEGRYLEDVY